MVFWALGKGFAECPTKNSRQNALCRLSGSRALFVMGGIGQRLCQVYLSLCRVSWIPIDLHVLLGVRPGATGLLIGIACSRVRDSAWMYLTSFMTTRIGVELAEVQENYLTGL